MAEASRPAVSSRVAGNADLARHGARPGQPLPSPGAAMAISRPVSAASTMASPSECIRCFSARSATAS